MKTDDFKLSALLQQSRTAPPLPVRFQQNVWRRIGDAEATVKPVGWLDAFVGLILQPRFAIVAAAILLLAGAGAGAFEGRQLVRQAAQMNYLAAVAPHALR